MKDRDDLKKQMKTMSSMIEAAEKYSNKEKSDKLIAFLETNTKTLNSIGVELFMDVKNHIHDLLRKMERGA